MSPQEVVLESSSGFSSKKGFSNPKTTKPTTGRLLRVVYSRYRCDAIDPCTASSLETVLSLFLSARSTLFKDAWLRERLNPFHHDHDPLPRRHSDHWISHVLHCCSSRELSLSDRSLEALLACNVTAVMVIHEQFLHLSCVSEFRLNILNRSPLCFAPSHEHDA